MQKAPDTRAERFWVTKDRALEHHAQNLKQMWIATSQSRPTSQRDILHYCANPCSDFGKSRSENCATFVSDLKHAALARVRSGNAG
jgi:hypothetical protein